MNPRTCLTKVAGQEVCFIHIPKTGGQSIQKALKMGLRRHLPVTDKVRKNELLHCDYAFAFVRNPYSWAESLFYWFATLHEKPLRRRPENAALNQWCRNTDVNSFWQQVDVDYLNKQTSGNMFRTQSWFLTRMDGTLHPRVLVRRFEDMAIEWAAVCNVLGVSLPLPHTNKSGLRDRRTPLNDESRARLRELYAIDFDNFYPTEK
jgi:hypothetical protein